MRSIDDSFSTAKQITEKTQARNEREFMEAVETRTPSKGLSKDDAMPILAHELRSPLAVMCHSLELIRHGALQDQTVDRAVGIMQRQVNYMTRLIESLLELSRAERATPVLSRQRFDFASIVAEAVETSRLAIDERGQELVVSLPRDFLLFEGDPVWLRCVVVNLLTNAARYTDYGGRIWLTVQAGWSEVVVRVRDNGIGIDPELLPDLFEPYTQGTPSAGAGRGLGIGLALVRGLVELHGGSIEVESAGPGQGSEFVARLPVCRWTGKEDL